MMNALDKLCPMKQLNGYCIGELCAWWLEFAKECAVPVAALEKNVPGTAAIMGMVGGNRYV